MVWSGCRSRGSRAGARWLRNAAGRGPLLYFRVDGGSPVGVAGALEEGVDHAADGFVEDDADGGLEQAGAELEVDEEADTAAGRVGVEHPVVVQVAERTLLVFDLD